MTDLIRCPRCGRAAGNSVDPVSRVTLSCQYCGYPESESPTMRRERTEAAFAKLRQAIEALDAEITAHDTTCGERAVLEAARELVAGSPSSQEQK